jgi:hypothetical protein
MMERGLDHLVYATPDLDASAEALAERFGTVPVPGGAHPGRGTRNALIGLGIGVYLEIIGPDPAQPDPEGARPFLIDDLTDAQLVTWAYRHPDPEAMRDAIERRFRDALPDGDVRLGSVSAMSRARPDGSMLRWRLSDPRALPLGGIVPFVIHWGTTPHPSTALPNECKLLELIVTHPEADTLRPVLDAFRPVVGKADGEPNQLDSDSSIVSDISTVTAREPGIHARLETPNGKIALS